MAAKIWLGTSGFSYKEWRPRFYPADLPDRDFLRYYATRLRSVEINSSFYRMPSPKTLQAWKKSTTSDFRFALKAHQEITHGARLRTPSWALELLLQLAPGLEPRLGPILFQLPPSFRCDLDRLNAFLAVVPRGFRSAFEFRHESWFCREVYDALGKSGAALCIHDADDHRTPLEVTAPFVYVRLRRTGYDATLRREWRKRIRGWSTAGLEVFAYVKHEDSPDAPLLAAELAESLTAPRRAAS